MNRQVDQIDMLLMNLSESHELFTDNQRELETTAHDISDLSEMDIVNARGGLLVSDLDYTIGQMQDASEDFNETLSELVKRVKRIQNGTNADTKKQLKEVANHWSDLWNEYVVPSLKQSKKINKS